MLLPVLPRYIDIADRARVFTRQGKIGDLASDYPSYAGDEPFAMMWRLGALTLEPTFGRTLSNYFSRNHHVHDTQLLVEHTRLLTL